MDTPDFCVRMERKNTVKSGVQGIKLISAISATHHNHNIFFRPPPHSHHYFIAVSSARLLIVGTIKDTSSLERHPSKTIMAQGGFKLKSSKPDPKKARATHQKQQQLSKGRKAFATKGRKAILAKQEQQTSKAINRKNEMAVAARAVGAGNTFFLKDIKEAGKKEMGKRKDELKKRESKSAKMSDRLKEQLNKLK